MTDPKNPKADPKDSKSEVPKTEEKVKAETAERREATETTRRSSNETAPRRDTSSTGSVNKSPEVGLSSVGARLSDEADVSRDGILDAGGPYVAEAPRPTPAEAVSYPATGGLPDTGPASKYVQGSDRGVKLFNEDGERVDRDGRLINEFGDRIVAHQEPPRPEDAVKPIPAAIKAEMDAGAAALKRA